MEKFDQKNYFEKWYKKLLIKSDSDWKRLKKEILNDLIKDGQEEAEAKSNDVVNEIKDMYNEVLIFAGLRPSYPGWCGE